jgi:hypothetical protein
MVCFSLRGIVFSMKRLEMDEANSEPLFPLPFFADALASSFQSAMKSASGTPTNDRIRRNRTG